MLRQPAVFGDLETTRTHPAPDHVTEKMPWHLHTWLCIFVLPVFSTWLPGCIQPQLGNTEAELALEDLATGTGSSRLKAQGPEPSRKTIHYESAEGLDTADLYLPAERPRAGIVLVPGVVAEGKDDPRLVATAYTLARLQFTVLVPDMPGVRRSRVRASDVGDIADAFAWLVSRDELAPPEHVGIAGFSYGAGPVLVAALRPDIRARIRFVLAVGGYYSLRNVVTYFTTGRYAVPGITAARAEELAFRAPHPYIKWVFIRSNIDLLEHAADRAVLGKYADQVISGAALDEAFRPAGLAPDAQAIYNLLVNENPARVPALIEQLPPRIRNELEGVNPAAHELSAMQAHIILLHGRSDTMIPYTESIALARALPEDRVKLIVIDGLAHVDLQPKRRDIPLLINAMNALLAQREPQDNRGDAD